MEHKKKERERTGFTRSSIVPNFAQHSTQTRGEREKPTNIKPVFGKG